MGEGGDFEMIIGGDIYQSAERFPVPHCRYILPTVN
jgi:hypothetical protein